MREGTREQRRIFAIISLLLIGMQTASAAEVQRAKTKQGKILTGQLQGTSPAEIVFQSKEEATTLDALRQIGFPASSFIGQNERPARVFQLQGGGRITGELVAFAKEQITIKILEKLVTLPSAAILSISQPTGERQVFYDDFEADKLSSSWIDLVQVKPVQLGERAALRISPGGSLSHPVKSPLANWRCGMTLRAPAENPPAFQWGVELQMIENGQMTSAKITFGSSNAFETLTTSPGWRLTVQPMRKTAGEKRVSLICNQERFQVLLGSHLLAYGTSPKGSLKAIRVFCDAPASTTAAPNQADAPWVDDVQLIQWTKDAEHQPSFSREKQHQVLLFTGDVLYGDVKGIDSREVLLDGKFGPLRLPWSEIRRVILATEADISEKSPPESHPLFGWQSRITFQTGSDHPRPSEDWLLAAIEKIDGDSLSVNHPLLGLCQIPLERVESISPRFLGTSLTLFPQTAHLGNQIEVQFQEQPPRGSTLAGSFSLKQIPAGAAYLRLNVAELEPARRETPIGSRFLPQLRNGFLGTQVLVNGQPLGRLNDLISRRTTRAEARSLRIPIPAGLLRVGDNNWKLLQTPLRDDPTEFDDCEIGPISLEIETPHETRSR